MLLVQAAESAAEAVRGKKDELFKLLGHPVRIEITERGLRDVDVRGGSKITSPTSFCTSGFIVKNASNVTAMTTASHCEGMNTYYNPNGTTIPLTFVTEVPTSSPPTPTLAAQSHAIPFGCWSMAPPTQPAGTATAADLLLPRKPPSAL
jgi:hypothetical protein